MPPSLRTIRRRPLSVKVREAMEASIRCGAWKVGERIPPEPELAVQFGVSHNTVREAVQGLIHAGMLAPRPGDGTYVTATDRLDAALDNHLEHVDTVAILQARLSIEQAIVALAATTRTEEDLQRMQSTLQACKAHSGRGIEADMAFHATIADATRNPILSRIYRVIIAYLSRHFTEALEERQYDPAAIALHDELLDALHRKDAAAARRIVADIVAFDSRHIL